MYYWLEEKPDGEKEGRGREAREGKNSEYSFPHCRLSGASAQTENSK